MSGYFMDMYIHHIFGITYIISEGLFALATVVIANRISFTWKGILNVILRTLGVWAAIILTATIWQFLVNLGNTSTDLIQVRGNLTFLPLVLCLYMLFFSRYKFSTRVVVALTFFSAYQAILTITEGVGFILRVNYAWEVDMTLWLVLLLTLALMAFLYYYNFDSYVFVPRSCLVLMGVCAVVTFTAIQLSRQAMENRENYIAIVALLLVTELLCYSMLTGITRQYGKSVTQQVIRDRKAGAREMLLISQASYDNMHVVLHDIKNQFSTLRALLDAGKYAEASEFLDKFEIFASPVIETVDCGNVVVDSVMSVELAKAREKRVKVDCSVVVPPVLAVSDSDLVSLIGNLLDNAIDSCHKDEIDGPVRVEIRYQGDYLFVNVSNPVKDAEGKRRKVDLHTQKGLGHGYGTRIVRGIAEKYNGLAKYEAEDNVFRASAMLAIPVTESSEKEFAEAGNVRMRPEEEAEGNVQ